MTIRCDFCIEEDCDGSRKGCCDCDNCDRVEECPRVLRPTIRITTRCTQKCGHCCYDSTPDRDDMMSVETARSIQRFLDANDIWYAAIMGGEIFCNPDWEEIVGILCTGRQYVRLVTNGDWAGTDFLDRLADYRDILNIAISNDKWHTNDNVEAAAAECEAKGFRYCVADPNTEDNDNVIAPVGRGAYHYGLFSMFACYCHNPEKNYTFLIDETGTVFKCGFGVWDYAEVADYEDGGFAARFKAFNQVFYGTWISSCTSCRRSYRKAI